MSDSDARLFRLRRRFCKASAIAAIAVACLVLIGWALDYGALKSVFPEFVTMKANAALCFALAGAALWLLLPEGARDRDIRVAQLLALLVVVIAVATLLQYFLGVNFGIDQLLVRDIEGSTGTSSPGRMAPMTATGFVALGAALLLLGRQSRLSRWLTQVLSLGAGLIAILALNGYIYRAAAHDRILLYTQIALHTAAVMLLLSVAIFFARPHSGIAADLTGERSGSVMARRFLPAVFLVPAFLGWIFLQGQAAGWYGTALGLAFYAVANTVAFALLVWINARQMNVEHGLRSKAEVELRQLNMELEQRVAERTAALEHQAAVLAEQAALIDLAPDAIVVRDMQGKILFWNHGAETTYGWTSDEAVGTLGLLKTEFSEPLEVIQDLLRRDGVWRGETVHHARDGSRLTMLSRRALQHDANGVPSRILSINSDISRRKQAEAQLLETVAELHRSNEELAQFAYIASHDLQEPLRMVANYTALLAKRYKGRLDSDADEFIAFAVDGATRMKQLIQDLLEYSRVGTKGKKLVDTSSETALRQALINLRGAIEDSGAVVTHDPLPSVVADEMQLTQLFQNLVGNAIKYQKPGVPQIHVSARHGGARWHFSVRDNGLGIAPEHFERIFGMFQRLHGRGDFAGTGIGLAICKKIVERHGGSISVESQAGEGSVFRFALAEGSAAGS